MNFGAIFFLKLTKQSLYCRDVNLELIYSLLMTSWVPLLWVTISLDEIKCYQDYNQNGETVVTDSESYIDNKFYFYNNEVEIFLFRIICRSYIYNENIFMWPRWEWVKQSRFISVCILENEPQWLRDLIIQLGRSQGVTFLPEIRFIEMYREIIANVFRTLWSMS